MGQQGSRISTAMEMPGYLRNAWYPAMWSDDLPPGKLFARTLLDMPMLFFRRPDGSVAAIANRCAHRFAPLSEGKLLDGGRVQCPYHGLEFDGTGACVHNPHGNGTIPAAARVPAWTVVEKHSILWAWPGSATPDVGKIPDFSCFDGADPLMVSKRDHLILDANWQLIVDNLLDLSHTSYLHEGLIGNAGTVEAEIKVEQTDSSVTVSRHSHNVAVPGMFDALLGEPMALCDKFNWIRFMTPSSLVLQSGVCAPGAEPSSGTGYYGVHLLVPQDARTTHYYFSAVRWGVQTNDPTRDAEIQEFLSRMRRYAFAEQDGPIIATQQQRIDAAAAAHEALEPVLLSIDTGPVRWRRMVGQMLASEMAAS